MQMAVVGERKLDYFYIGTIFDYPTDEYVHLVTSDLKERACVSDIHETMFFLKYNLFPTSMPNIRPFEYQLEVLQSKH